MYRRHQVLVKYSRLDKNPCLTLIAFELNEIFNVPKEDFDKEYPCSCIIHLIQNYVNFKEAVINSCNLESHPSIDGQMQTSRVVTTVFHNRPF